MIGSTISCSRFLGARCARRYWLFLIISVICLLPIFVGLSPFTAALPWVSLSGEETLSLNYLPPPAPEANTSGEMTNSLNHVQSGTLHSPPAPEAADAGGDVDGGRRSDLQAVGLADFYPRGSRTVEPRQHAEGNATEHRIVWAHIPSMRRCSDDTSADRLSTVLLHCSSRTKCFLGGKRVSMPTVSQGNPIFSGPWADVRIIPFLQYACGENYNHRVKYVWHVEDDIYVEDWPAFARRMVAIDAEILVPSDRIMGPTWYHARWCGAEKCARTRAVPLYLFGIRPRVACDLYNYCLTGETLHVEAKVGMYLDNTHIQPYIICKEGYDFCTTGSWGRYKQYPRFSAALGHGGALEWLLQNRTPRKDAVFHPVKCKGKPIPDPRQQLKGPVLEEISARLGGVNFLIFGTGYDSLFWMSSNPAGNTRFLEHHADWVQFQPETVQEATTIVQYSSSMIDAEERVNDTTMLRRFFDSQLPYDIKNTTWDTILVDSPEGWPGLGFAGRGQSIFAASLLQASHTEIFVDDCERHLESLYIKVHLQQTGRNFKRFINGHGGNTCYISAIAA